MFNNSESWRAWAAKFPQVANKEATPAKFVVRNSSEDGRPEILIYDQIGVDFWGEGVSAKDFAEALNSIPSDKKPRLRINSPGGNVYDGLAIYNLAKARGVDTVNDGVAASAASLVLLAGDEIDVPESSLVMIHEASWIALGNKRDFRKAADILEKHDDTIANIYETKSGKSRDEIKRMMEAETWMDGRQAVEHGFATKTNQPSNTLSGSVVTPKNDADAHQTTSPRPDSAQPLSIAVAVGNKTAAVQSGAPTKGQTMETTDKTAAASNPAIDFKPVTDAINALRDELKPKAPAGAAPVSVSIENLGNPAVEKYNSMLPGAARSAFRLENHTTLMKERAKIQNVNTIDTALVPDYMSDALITIGNNKLASIRAFSLGVGLNSLAPRQTVQVTLASAASTTLKNATNFEQGNSTLAGQPVTVDQYTQPFHLTNAELNQGIVIQKLASVNADALANKLSDVVTALMIEGNYGSAVDIGAAASFTSAKLPVIWSAAKNYASKNLLLDGSHLAYLLPTSKESFRIGEAGAYNFDLIAEQNRWTDSDANAAGFVCSPDAIAVATGIPLNLPSAEFLSQATVQLSNGLAVVVSSWYSRAARNVWMSYDVMFGAGVGDVTQGEVLVTA